MERVIAIDPGPTHSGACVIGNFYRPIISGKWVNEELVVKVGPYIEGSNIVIEMVSHYGTGMPAGASVFDTCVWIGRYIELFLQYNVTVETLPRSTVKLHLCGNVRAKDSNIKQALVDRFAPYERNHGKGTKAEPGFFYGFSSDMWQAFALGVTYLDMKRSNKT
jgi:hypothetical protein